MPTPPPEPDPEREPPPEPPPAPRPEPPPGAPPAAQPEPHEPTAAGASGAPGQPPEPAGDTVSWRVLLGGAEVTLRAAGVASPEVEARWLVEEATGVEGAELALVLDEAATRRRVAHLDAMVARRRAGEPLQHVLGRWAFRRLDLLVDRRALIPRPETEVVAGLAIDQLAGRLSPVVVDLGTGTGAIALSLAMEHPSAVVWATDRSADALDLARANLAGLGRPASRVRLAQGDWFAALPAHLRGTLDLVVSNPPYVAEADELPEEVAAWEPPEALVPGSSGLEALEAIVAEAPRWLAPDGALVVEHAPDQAEAVRALARDAGFAEVRTEPDLTGRPRALVARRAT